MYYHFSSKEEIFNFLVEEGVKLLKNSIEIKTEDLINIAYEVIEGKYGNGQKRIDELTKRGYNAKDIQELVNRIKEKELDGTNNYTVVSGDTLVKIAKQFNTTWDKIYKLNKDIIGSDPNLIKIGQNLRI